MESPKVPMGWELHPLKRLISVASGSDVLDEVQESDSAIPVYGSGKGAFKYTSHNFSDSAAIIFGRKGSLGQPYIAKPPFWIVDTAYAATPTERSDFGFVYYSLLNFPWDPYTTKTAKPSLVATEILGAKVAAPGVAEQRKVAAFLDAKTAEIDVVVEKLRRQLELLERYKRELIAHTVTKGLDPEAPMKESGLQWIGEIPSSWKLLRIGALYDQRSTKVSDSEFPPLSVTMKGVLPQLENVAKTNDRDNRKLIRAGDFVINSRSDRRGACGVADRDGSCSLINIVLEPQQSIFNPYFSYLFRSDLFADEFYKWGHGIVDDLWTTNWDDMKKIKVPIPSYYEQQLIADYLDSETAEIDGLITDIDRQMELLGRYRKQVINDVVTGKVRVSEEA